MLGKGISLRKIGKRLGRSHTTLSREIDKHSRHWRPYIPCEADRRASRWSLNQRRRAALKNPLVFVYVRKKLRLGWSPEIIAGRLSVDHPEEHICPETIYKYIFNKKTKREKLWRYLELGRKKRRVKSGRKVKRKSKIKNAKSIDLRPKSVEKRNHSGHWETDNMEGVKTDKQVLSATVERMTRVVLLTKLKDRKSDTKVEAVINRINEFPKQVILTLTADNGAENTKHETITEKLNIPVYFCHPYHSWEKGSVENRIKKVRRILPKGQSLDNIPTRKVQNIEEWINNTPMKVLDYKTPYEKMAEVLGKKKYTNYLTSGALRD
ncbi:IS30 family transposase [Candidatus Microgenomates bacterium]|nr:IS30 family transposase [Candidatus Microgenomates bacterium]